MEDEHKHKKNPLSEEAIAKVLAAREQWIEAAIAKELAERKDLLPPWLKYPDIPNFSIGWRMGGGESYIMMWQSWAKKLDQNQLLAYFAQYQPIPVDWLTWVSYFFGFDDDIFSDGKDFSGIHWLEDHQLASYSEFEAWLNKFMSEDQDDDAT